MPPRPKKTLKQQKEKEKEKEKEKVVVVKKLKRRLEPAPDSDDSSIELPPSVSSPPMALSRSIPSSPQTPASVRKRPTSVDSPLKRKRLHSGSTPVSARKRLHSSSTPLSSKKRPPPPAHSMPSPMMTETPTEKLSQEVEQTLVDFFADRPIFYDQRLRDFKNRGKRDKLLGEIGAELGMSGNLCFTWFRNMRTMYGKLLKRSKSGQAAENFTQRQEWTLKSFSFLDSHLKVLSQSRKLGEVSTYLLVLR